MAKSRMFISLDQDVFLMARQAKDVGTNISQVCNEFLREFLSVETFQEDEHKLMRQLDALRVEGDDIQQQISKVATKLTHIRVEKERYVRTTIMEGKHKIDALRNAQILQRMG